MNNRSDINIQIINELLKYEQNVNIKDRYGSTALMHACRIYKDHDIFKILMEVHDADLDTQDNKGWTILMNSILPPVNKEFIKKLMVYNPNIKLKNKNNETVLDVALRISCDNDIINIILQNRKKFIEAFTKNNMLPKKYKFWKNQQCDFKIIFFQVELFREIINYM